MTGPELASEEVTTLKQSSIFVLLAILCACSEPEQPAQRANIEDSVIGAPLNRSLERAEGVDDVLQDAAAERRRALEEAEGR